MKVEDEASSTSVKPWTRENPFPSAPEKASQFPAQCVVSLEYPGASPLRLCQCEAPYVGIPRVIRMDRTWSGSRHHFFRACSLPCPV